MKQEDIPKTVFTTPYGDYEFHMMPTGLCGAPSTFQYFMDTVFRAPVALDPDGVPVPFTAFIAVYLDDICIFSKSEVEHFAYIRAVLQRFREHKLYCKPTKCEWLQSSIEFLGHQFTSLGLSVHPDKCATLLKWHAPSTVHELRSLLSPIRFWRGFIPRFVAITEPITRLTCKNFAWSLGGEKQTSVLSSLKAAVASAPLLRPPDASRSFYVVS